ncbi:SH3 domain-containing protein [Lacrimispora indolis]|uniref:SH3 domain-containing protein n=1 Tax=Lacrimispora indolis TaxID=69825 RepID=UPI000415B94F|nr:SH3 domain-containing protein [[Clostridium] methoxybenzovorans]
MNKLLTVGMLSACLTITMPMATWANNIEETVTTAQFNKALPYVTDIAIKYSANGVNIREEPNTKSTVLGQTLLNTTFEVILDIGGWSMITTEDGYAYIKSEYLFDKEVTYSQEDLLVFAKTACGEAQSYDDQEQRYVLSVLKNRINHKDYPNSAIEVAKDSRWGIQYMSWYDGNVNREIQQSNWDNARYILENGSILPDYVIGQSQSVPKGRTLYLETKYHCYWY